MWICAKCGTQAQEPEICSGCGSPMIWPKKEAKYQYVVIAYLLKGGTECIGPFETVTLADQWWDANATKRVDYGWKDYEVVLMEAPEDGQ